MDEKNDGLIVGYVLDGKGGAKELGWSGIKQWKPTAGTLWLHFDRTKDSTRTWLEEESNIDPVLCEALLAEDTRPRVSSFDDGMLLILRGINMNPDADEEDMVSVRMWCTPKLIITLRKFKLFTIQDIWNELAVGKGPKETGDFITLLIEGLIDRIEVSIDKINAELDRLEERLELTQTKHDRRVLNSVRRRSVIMRRFLVPQRDVLMHLHLSGAEWFDQDHRSFFREVTDQMTRIIEDLDLLHERALVAKDMLETYHSERMNKTMYWLTIVASVFLPLGFLTGLLGINVGGIPGADNPYGFEMVCMLLIMLFAGQLFIFRLLKLF